MVYGGLDIMIQVHFFNGTYTKYKKQISFALETKMLYIFLITF